MVDISGEALAKAGFSYKELNELTDRGESLGCEWITRSTIRPLLNYLVK